MNDKSFMRAEVEEIPAACARFLGATGPQVAAAAAALRTLAPGVVVTVARGSSDHAATCIGISQSGRSPDLVKMMRAAGLGGALTLAITNVADAPMAQVFDHTLALHAESYSAAEVLHGPSAIVRPGFPVLVLGVADAAMPQLLATAERLAGQGAQVFVTGAAAKGAVTLPAVDGLHPLVAPLALVVSFYAFIEAFAPRRGFDPDTPPHLRKVTETL